MINKKREKWKLTNDLLNQNYKKIISEEGIDKCLKKWRTEIKKNSISLIKDSYDFLKKDMDLSLKPYSGIGPTDKGTVELIETIKANENDLPIFEIEDDEIEYDIKFPVIPFKKFYIATNVCERIKDELYSIGGFFVLDVDKDFLIVIYYWNRNSSDGWAFNSFFVRKKGLLKVYDETKIIYDETKFGSKNKEINLMAMNKFNNLMKKLIFKINKKEYTTYKKYSYGVYSEKSIAFAYDIRSHKRHFWEDSGRFKIPKMSKEEILNKGYEIDELVFKDGQLRRDIPFTIIAEFKVGEIKIEEHKVYDLIEKKHFRQEEKLYKVLRELFPDEFIKRHDRRKLKGLELDFFIYKLNLAFEYDGEQHFDRELCENVFKSNFDEQVKRDRKKDVLCRKERITLIRIKYDEPLTKRHIKKKIKEVKPRLFGIPIAKINKREVPF